MEGVEIEAEPPSRGDPAPTAPAPAQREQEEVGRPAGAEEDVVRPRNGGE